MGVTRRSVIAGGIGAVGALALSTPSQAVGSTFTKRFPADFLWGVATSGFQSDGYFPDCNWTRYAAANSKYDPYENSIDFFHRYPEDIGLAAGMGLRVFRISIEWARIEPSKGYRDPAAIAHYDDLIAKIIAAGMIPMVTIDHWVYPGWVVDQGGWTSADTADQWLANAAFVVGRWAPKVKYWVTFNEPSQNIIQEFGNGAYTFSQLGTVRTRMIDTHRKAFALIHSIRSDTMVTSNVAYGTAVNPVFDAIVFDAITDQLDFLGVDYYYGSGLTNASAIAALTNQYWNIKYEPEGLYYALNHYHLRYPKLPLYVIENGMATNNGQPHADGYTRTNHLLDHLYWVQRAINDGIPVIGYNYWSITDNYEWGYYAPRFGLYTVDALTDPALTRRATDAVATYHDLVARGGVPAGYTPVIKPAVCSLDSLLTCFGQVPTTPPAP